MMIHKVIAKYVLLGFNSVLVDFTAMLVIKPFRSARNSVDTSHPFRMIVLICLDPVMIFDGRIRFAC